MATSGTDPVWRTSYAMLEGAEYCGKVIHHDVVTREEFDFYLKEWLKQKYAVGYPLGYLAFHGARGALMISKTS